MGQHGGPWGKASTYKGAWLFDQKHPDALEGATAKGLSAELAVKVADRGVRTGQDAGIEKVWRNVRLLPIYEGTSAIQRHIVLREMRKRYRV